MERRDAAERRKKPADADGSRPRKGRARKGEAAASALAEPEGRLADQPVPAAPLRGLQRPQLAGHAQQPPVRGRGRHGDGLELRRVGRGPAERSRTPETGASRDRRRPRAAPGRPDRAGARVRPGRQRPVLPADRRGTHDRLGRGAALVPPRGREVRRRAGHARAIPQLPQRPCLALRVSITVPNGQAGRAERSTPTRGSKSPAPSCSSATRSWASGSPTTSRAGRPSSTDRPAQHHGRPSGQRPDRAPVCWPAGTGSASGSTRSSRSSSTTPTRARWPGTTVDFAARHFRPDAGHRAARLCRRSWPRRRACATTLNFSIGRGEACRVP